MVGDTLSVESDSQQGELLICHFMRAGKRVSPAPTLGEIRAHAARELELLPVPLRELTPDATYPVQLGDALVDLAAKFDRRLADLERKP